jgi:hypothetical protein
MKKSVLAVICVTSCMALSCGFDLEIEKEVTDCFAWGGRIEKEQGCLMDETVCTEILCCRSSILMKYVRKIYLLGFIRIPRFSASSLRTYA